MEQSKKTLEDTFKEVRARRLRNGYYNEPDSGAYQNPGYSDSEWRDKISGRIG